MLTRSVEEAHVIPENEPRAAAAVKCVTDVIAHFGVVTAGSRRRQHGIIETYEGVVYVKAGDDFDRLVIKAAGPLDASQLAESPERIKRPMGGLLPEPKIDITFTKYGKNEQIVTHRFVFARDGHTYFEWSLDDSDGYRLETLDSTAALDYLERHLPAVEENAGQPTLSQGAAQISQDTFSVSFDTIRRNRMGHNGDDFRLAAWHKFDTFGYDTVQFVPEAYFDDNSRDGEFFSIDVPEALIPSDVLEYPDSKTRAENIASQMETTVDETTVKDAVYIVAGLPGAWSPLAVLIQGKYDNAPRPQIELRPTKVYDKSLTYLLQHPDLVANAMEAYREMTGILREPVTETNLQVALETGLLNRDQVKAREVFEDFVQPLGAKIKSASAKSALDKAFAALVDLGDKLKEVYSEEELTHYAQHNALRTA